MSQENLGTILVVDDDLSVQNLLSEMLKRMGYSTLVASSGQEALNAVASNPLDLVVLDARMPGMSGTEVFDQLQADGNQIKVVFVTGHVDESIEAIQEQHPRRVSVLEKPFTMQGLHDTVQQLLSH